MGKAYGSVSGRVGAGAGAVWGWPGDGAAPVGSGPRVGPEHRALHERLV